MDKISAGRRDEPIEPWMIDAATGRSKAPTAQQPIRIKGLDGAWYSPLQPLAPQAPQAEGRIRDYRVGENLNIFPKQYEGVPWWQLKALARHHDVTRINIETRKDEMIRQDWDFALLDDKADDDATDKNPHIKELRDFFKRPDKHRTYQRWMRKLLNDRLIYDAMALYPRQTYGDTLYSLDVMDPTMFKLLTNALGDLPSVDEGPAYQQVLHGLPAVDYNADELIYWISNEQSGNVYGFSPVEWIVVTVNIALRRQSSTLQYFTDGNIPDAIIGVPDDWGVAQIKALQEYWDSLMEGDTAARRHAKFVPGKFNYTPTREPELKSDIEEWLARISCAALRVPASPYIRQMNRATADNAKAMAEEQGLIPEMENWKSFMDYIVQDVMGFDDCQFDWKVEQDIDPEVQAACTKVYVSLGVESIDEVRVRDRQLPPIGMGNAVMTPTGPVLLEHFLEEADLEHENTMITLKNPPPAQAALPPPAGGGGPAAAPAAGGATGEEQQPPPKADGGVAKRAAIPIIIKPHGRNTKVTQPAARVVQRTFKRFFRKAAPKVAGDIADSLGFSKADDTTDKEHADARAQAAVDGLTFADWVVLADDTADALEDVYKAGGRVAIKAVGVDATDEMFQQVDERAIDYAKARGAELVGTAEEREDAVLLQATRDMLKPLIVQAIKEGWSRDHLAEEIQASRAFSDARAELIAQTEVAIADGKGQMQGYLASGVVQQKVWQLSADHDHEDECDDNAAQGAIDVDQPFSSGDDAEPAHPGCFCVVAPVVFPKDEE